MTDTTPTIEELVTKYERKGPPELFKQISRHYPDMTFQEIEAAAHRYSNRWEYGFFCIGKGYAAGWFWRHWAIRRAARDRFVLHHLPSGYRVTEFTLSRHARRFAEAVNNMADWSSKELPDGEHDSLGLRMHRAALDITGTRPNLHLVAENAAT